MVIAKLAQHACLRGQYVITVMSMMGQQTSPVNQPGMAVELCDGAACRARATVGRDRCRVSPGLRLCPACADTLTGDLRIIPDLYEECGRVLGGSDRPREKTSGGAMPGLPFNATAAEVRSAILGVLASWSALVAEERRVQPPRRQPGPLAAFLARHIEWLAAHAAAADASHELASVARWAGRVAFRDSFSRVRIGPCVEAACPGELVAFLRPQDPASLAQIVCSAEAGHAWPGDQWLRLGLLMDKTVPAPTGGERWLSAADIARLWNIAPGSVYRMASEQRWRRRSTSGRTSYHAVDVGDSMARRVSR